MSCTRVHITDRSGPVPQPRMYTNASAIEFELLAPLNIDEDARVRSQIEQRKEELLNINRVTLNDNSLSSSYKDRFSLLCARAQGLRFICYTSHLVERIVFARTSILRAN